MLSMFSTEKKDNQSNELDPKLIKHLEDFIQKEIERALKKKNRDEAMLKVQKSALIDYDDPFEMVEPAIKNEKKTRRLNPLTGIEIKPTSKGELEPDFFAVMMLSNIGSFAWFLGLLSCTIQITLGVLIMLDQVKTDFFSTTLSIPIKGNGQLRIVQILSILLSIMTQMDLLMGLRTIMVLPFHKKQKWKSLIGAEKCNIRVWFTHIFLPNFLKSLQGGLILVASFVVIIQSDSPVDVLKDYSALFVVSTVDNLFFDFAGMGYFGSKLSKKAEEVKEVEFEEDEKSINVRLVSTFFALIVAFVGSWIYVTIGQVNGRYVEQAFPLCDLTLMYNSTTNLTFLDIIGDDTCQFGKGEGTNVIECGWDGGDCIKLNERYPKCFAEDFSLLGNGECDESSLYNNKDCGFDNGDCIERNTKLQSNYPTCSVENIAWVGDGICNGGAYYTPECDFDGGDCKNCGVPNMQKIGNGRCDQGDYNTNECSYDGGDCIQLNLEKEQSNAGCSVANIGWIGDGICNGKEYASPDCGNDGGDCINCFVEDMMLIGDGVCNGGDYMSDGCSSDGGDCIDCFVSNPALVGDGVCNGGEYNSIGCDFDGGDCLVNNTNLQEKYSNCLVENPWYVGDGFCHGGAYYTEDCGWDGGDCEGCKVEDMSLFSNGVCDGKEYNTIECGFDGGDCNKLIQEVKDEFPLCPLEYASWVGDGVCDGIKYATAACGNDGGDCDGCNVDDMSLIGDGYCDGGEYNVDGCSFDGLDCVPRFRLLGSKYSFSIAKWAQGVLAKNNVMYGIPNYANRILKFDPNSTFSSLIGDDLGDGEWKWVGGVLGHDGMIYGVPCNAKAILRLNPETEETSLLVEGHPILEAGNKFFGGIIDRNGKIYFAPLDNSKVVMFDPLNTESPLSEIGDDLGKTGGKMWGGVLGGDDNIYLMPCFATRVLKISVNDKTTSFIGDEYDGIWKWVGGVLAKDGNIYGCPLSNNRILQINVKNQTTQLVGPDFGDETVKWSGFVEGADGFLYGIPASSNNLLRFDPFLHTATLIPLDDELHGGDWKWLPGALTKSNFIYAVPAHTDQVLSIEPIKFRP